MGTGLKPVKTSKLTGTFASKSPPNIRVVCQGVAHDVQISMTTMFGLPAIGESLTLLTVEREGEGEARLYGFGEADERKAFLALMTVEGLEPRAAMAILSSMEIDELAELVEVQDAASFCANVSGIDAPMAKRILETLRGKLAV